MCGGCGGVGRIVVDDNASALVGSVHLQDEGDNFYYSVGVHGGV